LACFGTSQTLDNELFSNFNLLSAWALKYRQLADRSSGSCTLPRRQFFISGPAFEEAADNVEPVLEL